MIIKLSKMRIYFNFISTGCQPPIFHIHVPSIGDDSSSNTSSSRINERKETQADRSKRPTSSQCQSVGVHSAGTDGRELSNISQSFAVTPIEENRFEVTVRNDD